MKLVNAADGWDDERIDAARGARHDDDEHVQRIPQEWSRPDDGIMWHHAVMNLPRTAVSFCDAFAGTFNESTWQGQLPMIHCYSFQKNESDSGMYPSPLRACTARGLHF